MIRLRLVALLVLAALIAGCGTSGPTSGASVTPVATNAPGGSDAPASAGSSGEPTKAPATQSGPPAETEAPTASTGPSAGPSPSPSSTAADACTGNQDNRDWYALVAGAVAWPVFCAALPKGWFLSKGSHRLAGGGKVLVSYKGPGGATLALSEGAFCADTSGCVPSGTDSGEASFGSLPATLVALDDGGWAIVADRGANPSWLLVATGVDEATTRAFGAALAEVAG